jgi:mannosyl-oligosaccharide alpha-1,2-mannosidase
MLSIIESLAQKSFDDLIYIPKKIYGHLDDSMEHLTCFAGGLFAMSSKFLIYRNHLSFMYMGREITRTCRESYSRSATKLGPEMIS